MTQEPDVVVVGAGLSGLRAATVLEAAGLTVQVLEARERVGGRTHSASVGGSFIDLGGQWVGRNQARMVRLCDDLGVTRFESGLDYPTRPGDYSYELDGTITRLASLDDLPVPEQVVEQVQQTMDRLLELGATVDVDAPWATPQAEYWDSMTVESWINETIDDAQAQLLFRVAALLDLAADPAEMSMLALMFDYATSLHQEEVERWRIDGGAQQLSDRLAARLQTPVRLGSPARRIDWTEDGATVHTDSASIACRRMIVATPPVLAGRLTYAPPMSAERDGLTSRYPSTSVIKCHAVYDRVFWADAGLNGWAVMPDDDVLDVIGDNSPPGGEPAVLVGFIQARNATRLSALPDAERRELVLGTMARLLGEQARTPTAYIESNWAAEEYSRGCFQCYPTPMAWVNYGRAWRGPVGPIHWAGSEYSSEWYGYMEGALASGDRAAAEILAELGERRP